MGRLYVFVVIVGALAGWLLSGLSYGIERPAPPPTPTLVEPPTTSPPATQHFDSEVGALELKREADGHFYAEVRVNNVPLRFLVDTGASGIALTREDARRAGLAVSTGMYDVVGQGASGDVRGEHVILDEVVLAGAVVRRTPAVILDSGHQSLLGQTFLRQFQAVEIHGDTLVLR